MRQLQIWAERASEYLVYFILAALPLERVPAFHPHLASFEVTVRLTQIAGVLLILCALPRLWARRHQLLHSPWRWAVLFLFFALLSTGLAVNLTRAVMVTAFIGFDIALAWTLSNELLIRRVERYQLILIVTGVITALFGLFQFFGDLRGVPTTITGLLPRYTKQVFSFPRVQAASYEPLFYANYLLIPLCLAIVKALNGKRLYLLGITVMMTAFWLTLSRGAYFGLAASFLLLSVWAWRHKFLRNLLISGVALGAGIGLATLFVGISQSIKVESKSTTPSSLVQFSSTEAKDEFVATNNLEPSQLLPANPTTFVVPLQPDKLTFTPGVTLTDNAKADSVKIFAAQSTSLIQGDSFFNRSATWRVAWQIFKAHPLFGTGSGTFGLQAHTINPAYFSPDSVVNNEPLELLAEHGLLGTLALLTFIGSLLAIAVKKLREGANELTHFQMGLIAALIGTAVQYQTFSTLYITHIWVAIGLLVGALMVPGQKETRS